MRTTSEKNAKDFEAIYNEVEKIVNAKTFYEITARELADYVKAWISKHQDISFTIEDIVDACEDYEYEVDTE